MIMAKNEMLGEYRMDIDLKEIGRRVKKERNKKHMTQPQLAKAAGLSVSFLSNIESGRQSMNLRALIAITNVLDVSADSLIRDIPNGSCKTAQEIELELASCTPKERDLILQIVRFLKRLLVSWKNVHDE